MGRHPQWALAGPVERDEVQIRLPNDEMEKWRVVVWYMMKAQTKVKAVPGLYFRGVNDNFFKHHELKTIVPGRARRNRRRPTSRGHRNLYRRGHGSLARFSQGARLSWSGCLSLPKLELPLATRGGLPQ